MKCPQIQSQSTCFSKFSWGGHAPISPSIRMPCMHADCALCKIGSLYVYGQPHIPYIFKSVQRFCLTNVKLLPPPLYQNSVVCKYQWSRNCEAWFQIWDQDLQLDLQIIFSSMQEPIPFVLLGDWMKVYWGICGTWLMLGLFVQ